jgi:hypothetical protein
VDNNRSSETVTVYRVWFDDPRGQRRFVDTNKGVWIFRDEGIWLDADWNLTTDLDACLFFIPKHRIVMMTKFPKVKS